MPSDTLTKVARRPTAPPTLLAVLRLSTGPVRRHCAHRSERTR
ncbi:hypothetical protein ACFYPC_31595 [Streptomyces sp. NPDC005808]